MVATWSWETLAEGSALPEIVVEVTEQTVILVPVATWDLFPGHYSPAYAKAQGQRDMYLNTIALQGIADRTVTDALGARTWIARRKLDMLGSVYPGDTVVGRARVRGIRPRNSPGENGAATAMSSSARASMEADFEIEMRIDASCILRAQITACRYGVDTGT